MYEVQSNVRYVWQLLSQFVSWEFCRYMREQDETNTTETDVLTFLRDMIVKRTEKSLSDITKHEIVAKLIMETRSLENASRMAYITVLSESVNKLCPELEKATNRLIHHLETFVSVRDHSDESRKELIQVRINDSINDFAKEAERLLPHPELIKVVESWNLHHGHIPQKPAKKVIYSSSIFEKVLQCLHFEGITPSEAKLIAVSLYEDKEFERMLLNAEAEPYETEADSEQFSLSQSSQMNEHIYSQEFGKNVGIQMNYNPVPAKNSVSHVPAFQTSTELPEAPDEMFDEPPQLSPIQPPVLSSHVEFSPVHHVISNISELHRNQDIRNSVTDNHMQFAHSSNNESPSNELNSPALHNRIHKKFRMINYQRTKNQSDSDTSDCEKNPQFRFLTPTLFKQDTEKNAPPKSQIVWLSDCESNDSSVVTKPANSQQKDPNWSSNSGVSLLKQNKKKRILKTRSQALHPSNNNVNELSDSDSECTLNRIRLSRDPTSSVNAPKKRSNLKTQSQALHPNNNVNEPFDSDSDDTLNRILLSRDPTSSMNAAFKTQVKPAKKKVRILESDSSETPNSSLIENEGNLLHRLQQLPITSVNEADFEAARPIKKRKGVKTVKLYSPNRSIHDFVIPSRKPVPASNDVPLHKGTNTTLKKRKNYQQTVEDTSKRKKCRDCNKLYKTAVALKRHVFLKHTAPPPDSDGDS